MNNDKNGLFVCSVNSVFSFPLYLACFITFYNAVLRSYPGRERIDAVRKAWTTEAGSDIQEFTMILEIILRHFQWGVDQPVNCILN